MDVDVIVNTSSQIETLSESEVKEKIALEAAKLGIVSPSDSWLKIINDISVHFAVWNGWSLDRITGFPLEEILTLLEKDTERRDEFRVGRTFRHSEDFSLISWKGQKFHLNRSQAKVIKLLYEQAMQGTNGLHQSTLGKMLNSSNTQFRLLHVFRMANGEMHPIWGTFLITLEPGVYGVAIDD